MNPIFSDLKVLELASVLAGPSVGQFFAELGAKVIKVENLKTGGDVTRSWKSAGEQTDDRSAYFCSVNWGKKSIALDLTTSSGLDVVHKLANKSDIIIASYKPGDAEKLKVDFKTLSALNPRLIYGQITGYGSDSDRVGYDAVIQAEAGFMDLNGEKDGPPTKMPVALIDILAAHHLKEGLLLALLNRERTGKGDLVEVSLIQAAISSLANQATNWLVAKQLPARQGSAHPNIAPYGESFLTKDGKRILLAVGSDRQFEDLLQVLGIRPLNLGEGFTTNQMRVKNREELNRILVERIAEFHSDDFLEKVHSLKIPAGVIQNVREVFEMKEAREIVMERNGIVGVRSFVGEGPGFLMEDSGLLPPPKLGEHTKEVVNQL